MIPLSREIHSHLDGLVINEEITLRQASPGDVSRLLLMTFLQMHDILRIALPGGVVDWNGYKKDLEGIISKKEGSEVVFLIESKGILSGYVWLIIDQEPIVWLTSIVISEESTNKGLGTIVIKTILETMAKFGKKGIQLGVQENNARGLRFWKKMGFQKINSSPKHKTLILEMVF